jgi:hypothetical protein
MVVSDPTKHERLKHLQLVTGNFNIRFYKSTNLASDNDSNRGTVYV